VGLPFDPSLPCRSFPPPPRRRARRRATTLLFVEQGGARFAVKSFVEPSDGPVDAPRRVQREIAGIEAFTRAGAAALAPVAGPMNELALEVDGHPVRLRHAIVFPFVETPTLYDAIATSADPRPMLAETAKLIRARHDAADSIASVHSDGSSHNVFADWTWFDFCEPHPCDSVRDAKALELLRFVASVVEVSRAGTARGRVRSFCDAYGDPSVLSLALDFSRTNETHMRTRMWARMLGRPDKLVAYWLGNPQMFRRIRTWDALDHALGG
jgi:hypothetical protein